MRRVLIAAAVCAAACGGKRSVPATAEVKATATQAQQGMSAASTNTQATIGLQSIGSSLVDGVASGNASTVDLSAGLADPISIAATAVAPPPTVVTQALRIPNPAANTASALVVGCLERAPDQTPTLYGPGQSGCTASDHLEVTYDNGDQVDITWSETANSFDLMFAVVAGPWTGTNLHYSGTANSTSASVSVTGAMKYSNPGSLVHVDADFNLTYSLTGSQGASGGSVSISVNGTATDHVALVRANEHWSLAMQNAVNGQTETVTIDWNGGIGVDVLKADANTTDHSVAFNLNLHVVSTSSSQGGSVMWSAGGDVEYDGGVAGKLIARTNQLYIDWNDGTEEGFDSSVLFGSFGV